MSFFSKIFNRKPPDDNDSVANGVSKTTGRAFIEALFGELYPGQTPKHAASQSAPQHDLRPGRPPVEDTQAYDAGHAWHYVTLGLTDLDERSPITLGSSSVRCELSMRVAKRDSIEPPLWPVAFLGRLASHVSRGRGLAQAVSFRTGPIAGAPPEAGLEGVVALPDPAIKPRQGPFGEVGVMLLVGLTGQQLDEIKNGGSAKLIADIAADLRRQIT